ncbi:putative cell cycle control protein [Phaeomoniella chlamydospora]|uniref:Pre-mRNA-splicing factor CWC2 n=1 Tax=Phaeomoniella chlamydospora TaxID=158046 RepID=A0A0G2HAH2_PHACM|nr:putative cell cycle control protein [Phaeomoniella chlamydospora]
MIVFREWSHHVIAVCRFLLFCLQQSKCTVEDEFWSIATEVTKAMAEAEVEERPAPVLAGSPVANDNSEDGTTSALTSTKRSSPTADEENQLEPPTKKTKIIRRKRRPARPQVDPSTLKSEPPPQTGTIFNIWYNKWSGGDREDAYLSKTAAPSRCNVAKDSGYTRADKVPGSYFCLFFARGLCPKGHECQYLHRLPTVFDQFNPNVDCFGRDKFSDYRDDMGGVGTFMRQNRTLYVGRIHVTDDIEEVVARHFQEWGQVDRIRVLTGRGVAFVTYTNEANSQFAKEAMAHQALDHNEVLNVRWATVDPNPLAAKREAARIEEQAAEAVRRALPAAFVAELEGRETPEMKRKRLAESAFELEGYQAPDAIWQARSKELEAMEKQAELEDVEREGFIEAAPAAGEAEPSTIASISATPNQDANGGIFSDSTLAALKNISNGKGRALITAPTSGAPTSGSLVAYGSDDDSD